MIPKSRSNCFRTVLSAGAALAIAASAQAAFTLVDNFETYTLGNGVITTGSNAFSNNAGPWAPAGGANAATREAGVSIVDDSGNKALAVGGTNLGAKLLGAPDILNASEAATYFFQVKNLDSTPNVSIGLSDTTTLPLTTTTVFTDFEVQIAIGDATASAPGGGVTAGTDVLIYRNGATATFTPVAPVLSTYFNIWMVVNNSANTWALYSSTGTDGPTSIASGIGFRNGAAANAIQSFLVASSNQDAAGLYIDNIYSDTVENLANPMAVPEPSSFAALAGLGALGFVVSRRRRAA